MDLKNYAVASNEVLENQIINLANSAAYNKSKIRVMPDGHAGKGAVVGSTITYTDKICPNTVGVDIACRVSLFKVPDNLDLRIFDEVIHQCVPTGFNVCSEESGYSVCFPYEDLYCWKHLQNHNHLRLSMGSLGAGNHYLALEKGGAGTYLSIHTGSRNLGKQVCEYYQSLAIQHMRDLDGAIREIYYKVIQEHKDLGITSYISVLLEHRDVEIEQLVPADELAYIEGEDLEHYLHDMKIINEWSWFNHSTIAEAIGQYMNFTPELFATCIHNYVDTEHNIIRKGAISAYDGEIGIIPLNMRDGVLIVRGKGNEDWNCSLPHGAGRIMSRGEACRNLSMADFKQAMSGIYTTCVQESTIDEAPMAYKDADAIISAIQPNAEIIAHLQEIYNFKAV